MNYDSYLDLMERTGGSFARAIVAAYYCADSTNRQRLLAAFPDLFDRYKQQYAEWRAANPKESQA